MLEQQLLAEYNNVDWEALKTTDPSKFLITQQEFQQNSSSCIRQGRRLVNRCVTLRSNRSSRESRARRDSCRRASSNG